MFLALACVGENNQGEMRIEKKKKQTNKKKNERISVTFEVRVTSGISLNSLSV